MTPEEFAKKMEDLTLTPGLENRHMQADDLMCEILCSMGYQKGVDIYKDMDKWHA